MDAAQMVPQRLDHHLTPSQELVDNKRDLLLSSLGDNDWQMLYSAVRRLLQTQLLPQAQHRQNVSINTHHGSFSHPFNRLGLQPQNLRDVGEWDGKGFAMYLDQENTGNGQGQR